jgi:hypothetical protein
LKKIITIITAIILGFSAFSQEVATVFGVVKDTNNKAIEYVSIGTISEKKPIGTTTNKNGEYSFKIPSNKNVKIQISCMGYQSKR